MYAMRFVSTHFTAWWWSVFVVLNVPICCVDRLLLGLESVLVVVFSQFVLGNSVAAMRVKRNGANSYVAYYLNSDVKYVISSNVLQLQVGEMQAFINVTSSLHMQLRSSICRQCSTSFWLYSETLLANFKHCAGILYTAFSLDCQCSSHASCW
jgi:hypothetical protein